MRIQYLLALNALFACGLAQGGDWAQWGGPDRSGVSPETGLLKNWPGGGPKQVWIFNKAGSGYAGPAVVGGKVYFMGTRNGKEAVFALDNAGKEIWSTPVGDVLDNGWGNGPRASATVVDQVVYVMSGKGTVAAVKADDGKIIWQKTMQSLGGKIPGWGYTESVLVDGERVVCTPGGAEGTLAALDKKTGNVIWRSKEITDLAQYSSLVPGNVHGSTQYIQMTMQHVFGVSPADGKVLWKKDWSGRTAVIPTPVYHSNHVYVTAGYGVGCGLVRINKGNSIDELYENRVMKNHHGGVVLVGDFLYGYSDGGGWLCQNFMTGEQVWADRKALGKGAVTAAENMLYCLDEATGTVVLADASPQGWKEHGRLTLTPQSSIRSPQGHIWTHPVISDGKLYLRDQEFVYCYDIKGG